MNSDLSKLFSSKVFSLSVMKERLPEQTYESLKTSIDQGKELQPDVANVVAVAMKDWATENGATHYTHWFQPLTGITAGKHDSFLSPQSNGKAILEFSGKSLIKGEGDASSFPNGGLRNTFEARGYTVWDCTSPAFIRDDTLYIPTAFCSHTGEALDNKTPLLRSMEVISKQAIRVLRALGNTTANRVIPTVGAEQEYFLIDREKYESRLDLKICGRTLFGAKPSKGQEMEDHYCGRIRIKIGEYMRQLDHELWKLGVNSKTKHNEVAPAQHELAPIFTSANIATDHNQLTMEMMRVVAKNNNLACLLHEKPFEWVNGSGKHNNWSLSTDDGQNLFEPGKIPCENMQFLIFVCAVVQAVDKYAGLLRMSCASAGNDRRLGGHEAPPAIISMFLGEYLTSTLYNISDGTKQEDSCEHILKTSAETLPNLKQEESDRNRTSPFAFTGNKFEFRMPGSSCSIASVNWVLNTAVAESLDQYATRLENAKNLDNEIKAIIYDTVKNHGKIIFNGNSYTEQWINEAQKLNLPNLSNTVDAAGALVCKKNIELLKKYEVLSEIECQSRYEIMLENYSKTVNIEAHIMLDMVNSQIIPSAINYMGDVSNTYNNLVASGVQNKTIKNLIVKLSDTIDKLQDAASQLNELLCDRNLTDPLKQAEYHRDKLLCQMELVRKYADELELVVSLEYWPMPNYVNLLHKV